MINLDLKLDDNSIKQVIENNYIGRNKYLNGLISILNSTNENKIIALDGDWGSGKTFFLKSLEYLMINDDIELDKASINEEELGKLKTQYTVFYYNAWENDDAPSAMLSLIYKLINDGLNESTKKDNKFFCKAINTIIKYSTAGRLDIKNDFFGEDWNTEQITDKIETSEEIKDEFKNIIDEILIENKNKILIIIDEIDRCKPTFAIDLLENIKHFYNDDRIVFIVATNNKQLGASICKVYGEKYDGNGYLDKFFDLNLELPNNYLEKYISAIDENITSFDYSFQSCREIAKEYNLTMREYNRYIKSINTIENCLKKNGYNGSYYLNIFVKHIFVPLLLCLKIAKKEMYYKVISGSSFDEIQELIVSNEYFYKLSRNITEDKYERALFSIDNEEISNEEKKVKEGKLIISTLKKIYEDLLTNNRNEPFKSKFESLLDILSMMS